jgi:hypothetical protein
MDPQKFPDLSIDIETLGVTQDAVIIQIGVVEFNTDTMSIGDGLVFYPDLEEQYKARRSVDIDALKWWTKTNPALLGDILNSKTINHSEVRARLIDVMILARSYWFKHPAFDLTILDSMYSLNTSLCDSGHGAYRKITKDVHTLTSSLKVKPPEFVGVRHDALADAIHQAQWVIKCFAKIQGWS